jgi:hypothetical protein
MKNHARLFTVPAPAAVLAGLVLASLSCSSLFPPTATPTATSTLTPTFTSTHTPTETPTITVVPTETTAPTQSYTDWPVAVSDSFDNNENGWPVDPVDDELIKGTFTIEDGKYLAKIQAKSSLIEWLEPNMRSVKSLYASVSVFQTGGAEEADYGLVFRESSGNFYYFGISVSAKAYILLMYNNGWSTLIKPVRANEINPDQPNELAVLADGSFLSLFINGEFMDRYDDETLVRGTVGVAMTLYNAGDQLEMEFDDFKVRAPKT